MPGAAWLCCGRRKVAKITHQRGSHRYYKSAITGKIVTSVPMHPGELSRSLLKKILKQVGWSEEQFRKLL